MIVLKGSTTKGVEDNYRLIKTNNDGELCVVPPTSGLPFRFFLTANGNGTGNSNLNGDYSATPTDFFYIATNHYDIYTLLVSISDNASFNQADYGAITLGLTNGVSFFMEIAPGDQRRLISTNPVKSNYNWLADISDAKLTSFAGLSQTLTLALHVKDTFGMPLTMLPGWKFIVRLNDNLTGLVNHTFALRGILHTTL